MLSEVRNMKILDLGMGGKVDGGIEGEMLGD